MKIEQSVVSMNADHRLTSEYEARLESRISFRTLFDGVAQIGESPASGETDRQTRLLMMIEALLARLLALISGKHNSLMSDVCALLGTEIPKGGAGRPLRALEMEWNNEFTQIFREHERSDFSSTGKIRTADGRSLDFKLELAMCRNFECERKAVDSGKAVVLRDPLVINFDGKATELSGKRFAFDLDADGKSESIDTLGSCSGYLAIATAMAASMTAVNCSAPAPETALPTLRPSTATATTGSTRPTPRSPLCASGSLMASGRIC